MRILLADTIPSAAVRGLEDAGCDVHNHPKSNGDDLQRHLADIEPDGLVVRSTRVNAEHLRAASSLKFVIRAGAGVNNIDIAEATQRGIAVCNCPGKNAVAVAELVFALLLSLDRFVPANVADLRQGVWNKATYAKAKGIMGRSIGILGLGNIGRAVASRAHAFGMKVFACTTNCTPEEAERLGVTLCSTPEELAARVDVLSVHIPATPTTKGSIGASVFDKLPEGALFINTSRAEVVDEEALLAALDNRGLRAGLDVFSAEPSSKQGTFVHPLAQHPGVVGTHHIGASTEQAQHAVADEVLRIVKGFQAGAPGINVVNAVAG